ncbi:MAG: ribonuclease G [Rhodospirillaceae bacterium]|nr:ribonuclease G [Rhodospirillaceae bacterium]|tara:strand:+ start:617 stop:2086 length:1470 start_codon:yes stop_codon:yes gene_type:complete
MKEEILINVSAHETRAALVEDGVLQEVIIERANRRRLVGNIYKGKVTRVLPGIQAAFIELGLERAGFLHASEIALDSEKESVDAGVDSNIYDSLKDGDELIVQVLKDPLGTKGARLTTFITLPSRYLVMMPNGEGVGVSSRINSNKERERLRQAVEGLIAVKSNKARYIVRTAAEEATLEELEADILFLEKLWSSIKQDMPQANCGALVYEELPLEVRLLRDMLSSNIDRVRVDSEQTANILRDFADRFMLDISSTIEHYISDAPIFDLYSIEEEIEKSLRREVPLKSGGYLILDQTEAMTTVDVNTGAYVGSSNLEETSLYTNLEAAEAIARQLRLRNLGGIIIIDFIDMHEEKHCNQVFQTLSNCFTSDHAKTQIMNMSPLGLIEMTRKRNRESLEHILCETCPSCMGRGYIKKPETVCYEIFREIMRQHKQYNFHELLVLAKPEVIEMMIDKESTRVSELEEMTNSSIRLQSESFFSPNEFDVVLM